MQTLRQYFAADAGINEHEKLSCKNIWNVYKQSLIGTDFVGSNILDPGFRRGDEAILKSC